MLKGKEIEVIYPIGKIGILEAVIGNMFSAFRKHIESNEFSYEENNLKRELLVLFQNVFNDLKTQNRGGDFDKEESIDQLVMLANLSNIDSTFKKLKEKLNCSVHIRYELDESFINISSKDMKRLNNWDIKILKNK